MQPGSFPFPFVQSPNQKHILILPPLQPDVTSTATSTCDTHTYNRQGHIVMLQMWGEVLAAGLINEKPLCKSHTCWISLPVSCKNLRFNSENYKCIWASWRHFPHTTPLQGPGSGKHMQKALSPLQSSRAVTWIRSERHKRGPPLIFAPKVLLTSYPAEHSTETGDGVRKQMAYTFQCILLIKSYKM